MACLLMAPGCQLNRSFFQMDSNGKVPFFGVDLTPKLPKRTSSVEGVSRLQSEPTEASPAGSTADADQAAQTKATAVPQSLSLPLSEGVVGSEPTADAPAETFR